MVRVDGISSDLPLFYARFLTVFIGQGIFKENNVACESTLRKVKNLVFNKRTLVACCKNTVEVATSATTVRQL